MHIQCRGLKITFFLPLLLITAFVTAVQAEVVNVDNGTLQKLIAEGVTIVDVRRPDEWDSTGIIEDSELLTFFDAQGAYDADAWLAQLGEVVDKDKPVILICRSGTRTKLISQWLSEEIGYKTIYNVTNGILAWQASEGSVVRP